MQWTMLAMVVAVGVLGAAVPRISRATVPLGVNVPHSRVDDPVVVRAVRTYQLWCLGLTILAIVGVLLTSSIPATGALWMLGLILAVMVPFALCRRPIIAAKHEQNWYDGVEVRLGADVTAEPSNVRPVWPLHLASLALALAGVALIAFEYPSLPDPLPTHSDASGHPDAWATKTWGTALTAPLIAMGAALLVAVIAWWIWGRRDTVLPDGARAASQQLRRENSRIVQVGLGAVSLLSTAVVLTAALGPLLSADPSAITVVVALLGVALLVPMVWMVVSVARAQTRTRTFAAAKSRTTRWFKPDPDSPDDDHFWKLGLIYYNPADPSAMVPKRSGIGYEPNAAHPAGLAIYLLALVAIVGAVASVIVASL